MDAKAAHNKPQSRGNGHAREISVLVRKAIHEIVSRPHFVEDGIPPLTETTFDIQAVFPVGLEFRGKTVLPLLPVATIPDPSPKHLDA